uniref:Translation initiation factor IF-3 n=1 Tax=Rhizophora mucronata TaxID=61149 RepID=A0A2P2KU07_RHIMU
MVIAVLHSSCTHTEIPNLTIFARSTSQLFVTTTCETFQCTHMPAETSFIAEFSFFFGGS